mmetsp:Transcript_52946/g.172295  ORF Transcript_52946/g.172295 Transcript_52946/m.172295 type:complete len:205 (+) Transcript_52946:812-1426(+)
MEASMAAASTAGAAEAAAAVATSPSAWRVRSARLWRSFKETIVQTGALLWLLWRTQSILWASSLTLLTFPRAILVAVVRVKQPSKRATLLRQRQILPHGKRVERRDILAVLTMLTFASGMLSSGCFARAAAPWMPKALRAVWSGLRGRPPRAARGPARAVRPRAPSLRGLALRRATGFCNRRLPKLPKPIRSKLVGRSLAAAVT